MASRQIWELVRHLPKRTVGSNKSHGGRLWVIAGSGRFPGAAVLASTAAARVGAGYVGLSPLGGTQQTTTLWLKAPDFIALPATVKTLSEFQPCAVAIGPGIGKTPVAQAKAKKILKALKTHSEIAVVVDADGLRALGRDPLPSHWILTPHSGELARLLDWSVKKVDEDRERAIREAHRRFGCIVVLKGHGTLIAAPAVGRRPAGACLLFKNTSGNAALAKAGTGDVLTGIIAGLLAQKVSPLEAARLGVWLHGWLADRWVESGRDHLSLMATDLLASLPEALAEVRATYRRSGSR